MKQYALVIFACISVSVFAADKPGISLIGTRGNARIPGQSGYAETVFDCMATGAAVIGVNSSNSVITELSTVDGFQLISPKMTNLWEAEFSPDCGMISNVPGRVFMRFAVRNAVRQ